MIHIGTLQQHNSDQRWAIDDKKLLSIFLMRSIFMAGTQHILKTIISKI